MNKRPIAITILASLFLTVGIVGFAVHLREPLARHAFQYEDALIELTELIAIACGVLMFQGRNSARWLTLAWMAFHVVFSFFDSLQKTAVHILFFGLIVYCLFRPDSKAYFQRTQKIDT
jgi:hypothetical protein